MAGGWARDGAVEEQIEASLADELARLRARARPAGSGRTHCLDCDEPIPDTCKSVYICGGYVETDAAYETLRNARCFKDSLIRHARSGKIYAECAGLLYLGQRVDDKEMSGILDVSFTLEKRFQRMGYYTNEAGIKGHAFHYTRPLDTEGGFDILRGAKTGTGQAGSWTNAEGNVLGTYLHTLFRSHPDLVRRRLM